MLAYSRSVTYVLVPTRFVLFLTQQQRCDHVSLDAAVFCETGNAWIHWTSLHLKRTRLATPYVFGYSDTALGA